MVAIIASITLNIGLDRWFEIRTKTIVNSSLSIADACVQENAPICKALLCRWLRSQTHPARSMDLIEPVSST
jgi:nitrogen fixation/metabolism regulation signal transduction histidine kinase